MYKQPLEIKVGFSIKWENFKTLVYKIRVLIWIAAFCICGVVTVYLIKCNSGVVKELSDNSNLIGVVGTLLGAFVGGIFTLLGTICINREQIRIQSKIRRKNVIYKPLYEELKEIHFKILEENPYPLYVKFTRQQQTIRPHPQFAAWPRMKMDTRYLEVPDKLKEILNLLEDKMNEYNEYRKVISQSIGRELNDILMETTGCEGMSTSCVEGIVDKVLQGDRIALEECSVWDLCLGNRKKEIEKVGMRKIVELLLKRCTDNEDVKLMRKTYEDWKQIEEKAILLLEAMIQNISTTCEG